MTVISSVSRKSIIITAILVVCALAGTTWGWYNSIAAFDETIYLNAQKMSRQEKVFVLPPRPPVVPDQQKKGQPADLRIWEVSARQPLPPRKEPLTAPGWKIVGVTMVDRDANVLLLFDKQTQLESLKVGDRLPGGAKIVHISQDDLRIVLNGQYMKLTLRAQ